MQHDIPRTATAGGYTFPTRADYLARHGHGRGVDVLDTPTIVAIQRDWHARGQNGCVFAMHAARVLLGGRWCCEVYRQMPTASMVREHLAAAIADPGNQILSLIFPTVERVEGVRTLVDLAKAAGCYQAADVDESSGVVSLRYRVHMAESWIVGFAPLTELPVTRRAPFAELAIRTKAKTMALHPDLNGDITQAHLADVDLDFDPQVTANLISKSKYRSARILGGELARGAAKGAKAKVTFDLSVAL